MLDNPALIRVLLVDDDPMVVSGLRSILGNAEDIEVVGAASTGEDALHEVSLHFPDLVLMDIQMPGIGGIEAIRRLSNSVRAPKIVALTSFDSDDNLLRALDAGAAGYILKDIEPTELPTALRSVMAGDPYLSPQALRQLIAQTRGNDARRAQQEAIGFMAALTAKEREVAILVSQGRLNREIAEGLFLSEATVKTHLNRVMVKLDTNTRVGVAVIVERAQATGSSQQR